MRFVYWGDGTRWGDPNVYWGSPSYRLEPGDPGYVDDPNFPPPAPVSPLPLKPKPKHNTMQDDYFPQSFPNIRLWCQKQVDELTLALGNAIGMTDPERTAFIAAITTLLAAVSQIVDLMEQLDELTANFAPILETQMPIIRATIKRAKTFPGCTPAIQTQLDWIGASHTFHPGTARPTIVVEVQRGRVKITGRKPGFEAYNLYWRKKGDVEWKLMAIRKRKFPYYDETPLAVANTPEVREYMAIGVINDEETGQPSEIKEVVYAG